MTQENKIRHLCEKGVLIPVPQSVEIGDEVNLDRISGQGVTIHSGCRIFGENTFISKGCTIGREGPATIDNCWLAPEVTVAGGYVQGSVFLSKSRVGYGSHVRTGCILEEEASIAHCVGIKQTILFPFVTLGSLINFCDCLMAGGTSRKNHSEVGSSYIHFNFTPNQDKATPSLMGDVPRGVMLNADPIFLGGQGGMVGPLNLNFGTVIAAGTLQRKDELQESRLLFGGGPLSAGNVKHTPGVYQGVGRIVKHNMTYIANLIALKNWYSHVRTRCFSENFPEELVHGLKITLALAIDERIKRLKSLFENVSKSSIRLLEKGSGQSPTLLKQKEFVQAWASVNIGFEQINHSDLCQMERDQFLAEFDRQRTDKAMDYIDQIKGLNQRQMLLGTTWLQAIVDHIQDTMVKIIPDV